MKFKSIPTSENPGINIPTTVNGNVGTENVADINGTCLPTIYEVYRTGQCSIFKHVSEKIRTLPYGHKTRFESVWNLYSKGAFKTIKAKDYLYVSNLYQSIMSGYHFKIEQIPEYNWLKSTEITKTLKLMKKYISPAAQYEMFITGSIESNGVNRVINGAIDIIDFESPLVDSNTDTNTKTMVVWEIKCTNSIETEHILQLAFYAWILENIETYKIYKNYKKKYYILNILENKIIELYDSDLQQIVEIVLNAKFESNEKISDEQFIASLCVV